MLEEITTLTRNAGLSETGWSFGQATILNVVPDRLHPLKGVGNQLDVSLGPSNGKGNELVGILVLV